MKPTEKLFVKWGGSLWHTVYAVTKNVGKEIVTECGLVRSNIVGNVELSKDQPDKGRHCWNCRKCLHG